MSNYSAPIAADDDLTFELLDAEQLAGWLSRSRANYIDERVAAGDTLAEATANADRSLETSFPGGSAAPGQLVGQVLWAGTQVAWLWIGPQGEDPTRWWVWDIEVVDGQRGRGLGRQTMLLAEQLARRNGATSIGLNVFAHNEVARALYGSLGYAETSVQMRKELDPSSPNE